MFQRQDSKLFFHEQIFAILLAYYKNTKVLFLASETYSITP